MVLAAALILAVRTARQEIIVGNGTNHNRDWEAEIEHALTVAGMLVSPATHRRPELFQRKDVPSYVPTNEDVQP